MISFVEMNQDIAYRGRSLFLPRAKMAEGPLIGTLTFGPDKTGRPRVLAKGHPKHFEVPRHAYSDQDLQSLGIHVKDLRPTTFPRIQLSPKQSLCLRDYQEPAWEALKKTDNGILNLACGKGKTVLAWLKAAQLKETTLVVSPQKAHLENWLLELEKFFEFSGTIGWVQGSSFEYEADIVLATIQTLARRAQDGALPPDFHKRFGLTIYDECHCMGAEFFVRAADISSGRRIGLSATPNRTDRNEGIFYSHLGKVFYSDVTQDLIPEFEVVDTGIFVTHKDEKAMTDRAGQQNVSKIREWLAMNPERNQVITGVIDKALAANRTVYALSHSVGHVKYLHSLYPNSTVIHGKVKSGERLDRLHGSKLVFATIGVGKEAYNRQDLDTLLLLTPFAARAHSAVVFQQSVGRIQRAAKGKKTPKVFLFLDRDIDICKGMIYSLIREAQRNGYPILDGSWTKRGRFTS